MKIVMLIVLAFWHPQDNDGFAGSKARSFGLYPSVAACKADVPLAEREVRGRPSDWPPPLGEPNYIAAICHTIPDEQGV